MNRCQMLVFLCLSLQVIHITANYKYPCKKSTDCSIMSESCENELCACQFFKEKMHYENIKLTCTEMPFLTAGHCKCKSEEDQTCYKSATCICKDETKVLVNGECMSAQWKNVFEKCSVKNNEAHLCKDEINSMCLHGTCVCYPSFYLNKTSNECIPKTNYTSFHKILEYRAMVGEYCLDEDDCIEGLECDTDKFTCKCPGKCRYLADRLVCDCGPLEIVPPDTVAPIIVGVLLGLASVILWTKLVLKNIKRKRSYDSNEMEDVQPDKMEAPVVNMDDDRPPSYSDVVTNAPPIGFNMTGDTAEQAPNAPYPLTPNVPYPVAPPTSAPYPVAPQNTPYPVDSQNTPYPVGPQTAPYPLDPNTNKV